MLLAAWAVPLLANAEADPIIPGLRLPEEEQAPLARMGREASRSEHHTESELRLALAERLRRSPEVAVTVVDGIARFSGRVDNHEEIDAMLATALMIDGVVDIRSDVRISKDGSRD